MAVGYSVTDRRNFQTLFVHPDLDTGDTGLAIDFFQEQLQPYKISVQIQGLSDSTATIQGSNDGTNFFTLKDASGTDIAVTANGLYQIDSLFRYLRPLISGGTDTAIAVTTLAVM